MRNEASETGRTALVVVAFDQSVDSIGEGMSRPNETGPAIPSFQSLSMLVGWLWVGWWFHNDSKGLTVDCCVRAATNDRRLGMMKNMNACMRCFAFWRVSFGWLVWGWVVFQAHQCAALFSKEWKMARPTTCLGGTIIKLGFVERRWSPPSKRNPSLWGARQQNVWNQPERANN